LGLEKLIAARRYLEVADHCKEHLKRSYFQILGKLRAGGGEIPEAHRLVVQVPFAALVTTNYDMLLERAWNAVRGDWPRVFTHRDAAQLGTLLFDVAPFILKAHGDADKPESIILTSRDYNSLIHGNPAFNAIFSSLLLTKAILFVGYSLHDPDFKLLMDNQITIFSGDVPDRFALMAGVGEIECEVLWRTAGIKVLPYPEGQHQLVVEFLRTLLGAVSPGRPAAATVGTPSIQEPELPAARGTGQRAAPVAAPRPATPQVARLSLALGATGSLHGRLSEVGPDAVTAGENPTPDWPRLEQALSVLGTHLQPPDSKRLGEVLAASLPGEVRTALKVWLAQAPAAAPPLLLLELGEELEFLPWELLWLRQEALAMTVPLARVPSGVSDATRGALLVHRPAKALLIGDPGGNLPGARREVEDIASMYRAAAAADCEMLLGQQATLDAFHQALETRRFDIVHFAGHAWYDIQEGYLALADDVHITASGLRPLLSRHPPAILFLNSHFTAFVPPAVRCGSPRENPAARPLTARVQGRSGFAHLASLAGVGACVGCFGSPEDEPAAKLAIALHREILAGTTIAEALFRARACVVAAADSTPLIYSLTGDATTCLRV
jgi:hypothetical protein